MIILLTKLFFMKCYTCFDGDEDIHYYRLMQAWHKNEKFDFTFDNAHELKQARDTSLEETIKRSLRDRLKASDVFIVLVGTKTKNLFKFVRWEIDQAISLNIPIIVINLNSKKAIDSELCPPILREKLAIHIPFKVKIVDHAIRNWPRNHKNLNSQGKIGPYHYNQSLYNQLGI